MDIDGLFQVIQTSQVTSQEVIISVTLAFILGLIIATVYKKTFKGITYSQSYTTTIALLAPIVAIVMLTIGSDLARAFGLVGALSIIRFRTVIKDTKDIMIIFLSLAAGLASGTLNYHIAIIGTLMILLFLYILDKIDYGKFYNEAFLVTFSVGKKDLNEADYRDVLEKYAGAVTLLNISTSSVQNKMLEVTYKVENLNEKERANISEDLTKVDGITNLSITSAKNYIEY